MCGRCRILWVQQLYTVKINIYLRNERNADTGTLQLVVSLPGQGRLRYGLGEKIKARYWDAGEQKIKVTRHNPGDSVTNDLLESYTVHVKGLQHRATLAGQPLTIDGLRTALDTLTGKGAPDADRLADGTPTGFYPFARYYFDERLSRKKLTKSSHRTHHSVFNQLEGWRPDLTFDGVTLDFHAELLSWLYGAPKYSSASTAGKYVKTIKMIMRAATEKGLTTNLDYAKKDFIKPKSKLGAVYLNPAQLAILADLDLTKFPRLDRVRDQFLVGCWTGLRYSDWSKVGSEHFTPIPMPDGSEVPGIKVTTLKTGETVTIPLHIIVRAILEKYGGQLPPAISNQKFNDYLKEVGERAGFTDQHALTRNRAGRDVTRRRRLCDVLTSHTARRSFATNMHGEGLPVASIRAITGHTTDHSFYTYVKTDADGHAAAIAASKHFVGSGGATAEQSTGAAVRKVAG